MTVFLIVSFSDQTTHLEKISDRSDKKCNKNRVRKKIKKEIAPCETYAAVRSVNNEYWLTYAHTGIVSKTN